METASKITDCYRLIDDTTFDQCLLEASKFVGLSLSIEEIRRLIEGKTMYDPTIIGQSGSKDIRVSDLFDEFSKLNHMKTRCAFKELVFWLMETILLLPDKGSKSAFFSDVYLQLFYLKIDLEYLNNGGVVPVKPIPYNSPNCTYPFARQYYNTLLIKIKVQLKKLNQRYGLYLTEEMRVYITTLPKIQAYYDLYDISTFERPMRTDDATGKPLSIFHWKKPDGDLIELVTALSLVKRIDTPYGEVPRIQLLNFFTDIFGMDRIKDQTLRDRTRKNFRRRKEPAKFLKKLIKAYEDERKQKMNNSGNE